MEYMVIILLIILSFAILSLCIGCAIHAGENGGILDNETLEEYLNKLSDNYKIYQSEYSTRIDPLYNSNLNKSIEVSPRGVNWIFPYYIEYVGIIPFWSKSKKRIDAMFATFPKRNWKREKLGLD